MSAARTQTYVLLNPKHATQVTAIKPIQGNVLEYMREICGGAVLVRLISPLHPWQKTKFTIERLTNSRDAARRAGWKGIAKFEGGDHGAILIGGYLPKPKVESPTPSTKKSALAKVRKPLERNRRRSVGRE